jgi:redox-sensitive bicupin YhaK (pirin superfamily)
MWIIPSRRGLEPSVEQREFPVASRRGRWLPVLVPAEGYGAADAPGNPDAVTVHQDATVYASVIEPGGTLAHRFRAGFNGYLFVVHGAIELTSADESGSLDEGGAARIVREPELTVRAGDGGAELLLVETRDVARS